MVGYGPEDNHFVVELTYNYGLGSYKLGNDFMVCYYEHMIGATWKIAVRLHVLHICISRFSTLGPVVQS